MALELPLRSFKCSRIGWCLLNMSIWCSLLGCGVHADVSLPFDVATTVPELDKGRHCIAKSRAAGEEAVF